MKLEVSELIKDLRNLCDKHNMDFEFNTETQVYEIRFLPKPKN